MFGNKAYDCILVEIDYSAYNKEWATIKKTMSVYKVNYKILRKEILTAKKREKYRNSQSDTGSFLSPTRKNEKWEQHVKQEDNPHCPSYGKDIQIIVGQ